jgi:hypothetical protein
VPPVSEHHSLSLLGLAPEHIYMGSGKIREDRVDERSHPCDSKASLILAPYLGGEEGRPICLLPHTEKDSSSALVPNGLRPGSKLRARGDPGPHGVRQGWHKGH